MLTVYLLIVLPCFQYRLSLLEVEARRSSFQEKSLSTRIPQTANLIQLSYGFHSGKRNFIVTLLFISCCLAVILLTFVVCGSCKFEFIAIIFCL